MFSQESDYIKTIVDDGTVFIDVGAYVGNTVVAIAPRVSKVVAIEAYFKNFCQLVQNIQSHNLSNVIPLCLAAWNKREIIPLYLPDLTTFGKRRYHRFRFWTKWVGGDSATVLPSGDKVCVVYGVPLDNVFDLLSISPSLIKIDVTLSEFKVLEGLRNTIKKTRPTILLVTVRDKEVVEKEVQKYNMTAVKIHCDNDYLEAHGWLCR